ncbi:hypothetical protein [Sinomonas sp. P47F7]|uniref:hypothetical protein n=1 Tax=Sinomonas sp. P47F7 TaxID=3410987 RepID=UPI003BF58F3E
MTQDIPFALRITAESQAGLDAALGEAVERAIGHALAGRSHGVLVTRHGRDSYTVEVTDEVPFGFTQERDHYTRTPI